MTSQSVDPVLKRRGHFKQFVRIGKLVGYSLFAVACVIFVVARIDEPRDVYNQLLGISMGVGSLFLAPAIVFGYAVKAAEREDRQREAARKARETREARGARSTPSDRADG